MIGFREEITDFGFAKIAFSIFAFVRIFWGHFHTEGQKVIGNSCKCEILQTVALIIFYSAIRVLQAESIQAEASL